MSLFTLCRLSALLNLCIGARLVPDLAGSAVAQIVLAAVSTLCALGIPIGLVARRFGRRVLSDALSWAGLLCVGLFSSLLVLTRDVFLVLLWLAELLARGRLAVAHWSGVSAQAVTAIAGLVTLLGFLNAKRTAAVVCVDVPLAGLPAAWHGFAVAQISDIHIGPTIRWDYVRRVVDKVNALEADMVAITGDLVDGGVGELAKQVAPLADLRSRRGTFFVTGNHEYYSGANAWIAELRRLGMTVLLNEHVVFEAPASAPLVLAGVTDFSASGYDAAHRRGGIKRGLSSAAVGPHPRRTVRPLEPVRALSAAIYGGLAQMGSVVGLYEPGRRLLGPAQALWCAV